MPIGSERVGEGLQLGYDDGSTNAEVVHKTTTGYVWVVNVTVDGDVYQTGGTFSIRDGTGNVVWQLDVPNVQVQVTSFAFPVNLSALFGTDIRTLITPAGAGHMTVSYQ